MFREPRDFLRRIVLVTEEIFPDQSRMRLFPSTSSDDVISIRLRHLMHMFISSKSAARQLQSIFVFFRQVTYLPNKFIFKSKSNAVIAWKLKINLVLCNI